jgi:hypothetical protein
MPAKSFQAIMNKALKDYHELIGVHLDKHPFAKELRSHDSPDKVLKLLKDKANAFKVYRDGNRKLISWLTPVVQVVHTLSGILGEAVSLMVQMRGSILLIFSPFGDQVPIKPAKAIFVGVDVLITVRIPRNSPHTYFLIRISQAADGVSSSYDALVELFECVGYFLKRLRIYTNVPMTAPMTDMITQIMVELLSVFALATKQIKQGRFSEWIVVLNSRQLNMV